MRIGRRWFGGSGRKRTVGVLLAVGAVAAALLVVLPALGSSHENAVRLQVNPTGVFQFASGGVTQGVTAVGTKGCEIGILSGPLVNLSSNTGGGIKGPGVVGYGIGVKSGGSNGTPCSQTGGPEILKVASANGRSWSSLSLDLELKGNAWVLLTLFSGNTAKGTYELVTGSSIEAAGLPPNGTSSPPNDATSTEPGKQKCANPSDSGPDSGPNDNCYWHISPVSPVLFDRIEITTAVGTVSLEGGADYASGFPSLDRNSIFRYGNTPPVVGGSGSVDEEGTNTFVVATDADLDPLTSTCTSTSGATITDNTGGAISIDYGPAIDFIGPDTLSCTVSDGTTSVTGSFSVTVNNVNDDPVAKDDDTDVDQDGSVVIGVLVNDTDVDGDSLSVASVTQGADGVVVTNGTSVTYTPDAGFVGPDSFDYVVSDGNGGSDTGTVTVTVVETICTAESVAFFSPLGTVNGSVTKITDGGLDCKRFLLVASDAGDDPETDPANLRFIPVGETTVNYRVFVTFPGSPGTVAGATTFPMGLMYDPDDDGLLPYQPLLMCNTPEFDSAGNVVVGTTELPLDETWCIASFSGEATIGGQFLATWQLYGEGDPGFRKG